MPAPSNTGCRGYFREGSVGVKAAVVEAAAVVAVAVAEEGAVYRADAQALGQHFRRAISGSPEERHEFPILSGGADLIHTDRPSPVHFNGFNG